MDGLLIVDKPAGLTSHDVVSRARRILGERRVGHSGTLDPFATGVLVLLIGRATRIAQFLSGAEKEYEAWMRFGYRTATGDITGERLQRPGQPDIVPFLKNTEDIDEALSALRGEIDQVPPMHSAKKIRGKKLYEYARRGEEIPREAVRLTISELEIARFPEPWLKENGDETCDLRVRIVCSAGTYIRTLAESVGERLDVPAHVSSLRRIRAGEFKVENAVTLEALENFAASEIVERYLIPADKALSQMPFLPLAPNEERGVLNGVGIRIEAELSSAWRDGEYIRLRNREGDLVAVGIYDNVKMVVRPRIVLGTDVQS